VATHRHEHTQDDGAGLSHGDGSDQSAATRQGSDCRGPGAHRRVRVGREREIANESVGGAAATSVQSRTASNGQSSSWF
jgi:hypothetical protein